MKKDIHPDNYRPVIFLDTTSGEKFLIPSTVKTQETETWEDGEEYPLCRIDQSSASHPFYTGVEQVVDTAGRVEKFKARMEASKKKKGKTTKSSNDDTEDSQAQGGEADEESEDESNEKES